MGGNLYKLGRLPRVPYLALEHRLRGTLTDVFGDAWRIPHVHTDKPDFGDLDVLLGSAALPGQLQAFAQRVQSLNVTRIGPVISHEVPLLAHEQAGEQTTFQVDLFRTPADELQVRHAFMSWGDLGNILGRMVRPWNLKWGEDGLVYVHRRENDEHYRAEFRLSQDIHDVFRLLNLDAAVYDRGFADERQMFEWVLASPHFSARPYQAREGDFRGRLDTRPGMERFAALVIDRFGQAASARPPRNDLAPLLRLFPHAGLDGWLQEESERAVTAAQFRAKFGGRRVMALRPELSGSALGAFMKSIVNTPVGERSFTQFVLDSAQQDIDAYLLAFAP